MKLKKLELFGFKSFYDKTVFDFSDGITAIVGPNGCGKSNIVDAIRWVLGEHAPSYLRSKALEDVIFAGSDAAGPLGMAEVALTFDNEDGLGPPGYESYAEIQVTRRTFRDGESEFFINKIPCRLKDIAELFLDTGAGARGYAIIEQGKIMTIVNARPEEKRLIIEEAAGVAKFRVRRKEAERKMENARQNLDRVKDVLEEVKRQLGALERQVRKAEKFKVLKDELRGLDLLVASRKHRELVRRKESFAIELSAQEAVLAAVRTEVARLEAERETCRIRLAEAEGAVRRLRETHGGLKEEIARRQAEWEAGVGEAGRLKDMIAESSGEIETLEKDVVLLSGRIDEAEGAALRRKEELAAAAQRFAALKAEAEEMRRECQRREERLERAKSDLMIRVTALSNAQTSAESLRRLIDESDRSVARLEERIEEAGRVLEKAGKELAERRAQEAASREALAEAERGWEEAGGRLSGLIDRLDALVETRRKTEVSLQASTSRLSALRRLYEQRDWTSSGVRAVLRHYNGKSENEGEGESLGIVGVIGDLVETEDRYEKAVEAVLGERMQSIVVRDHAQGLSALRYLKESREGRGTFVPVALRARGESSSYAGEDGVIAPLAELVRVPPECREIVQGLLGGAILVRDMECALRLWNRNGVWSDYVTLDGDLMTAEGALIGGSRGEGETGILSVKREIRELEREISGLSAEAERLEGEEESLRRERAAFEERKAEAFRRREEAIAAVGRAEQERALFEASGKQAERDLGTLVREKDYLEGERSRMADDYRSARETARIADGERGEEEERVRLLADELRRMSEATEQARARAHAAEIEWTGLDGRERSERTALEGLSGALAGKRSLADERRRRKTVFEERALLLEDAVNAGRAAIEEAAAGLSGLQDEIERGLGEAGRESEKLRAAEEGLKESRVGESGALDRISALRLDVQRSEMDIAALEALTYQRYEARPEDLPAKEAEPGTDPLAELAGWESRAGELREKIAAVGDVNLASIEEHRELSERHTFLASQKEDLEKSLDDLARAIQRINRTTRERFTAAFEMINAKFQEVFPKLFLGGRASLRMLEEDNPLETGVEIVAQPPGKKLQSLTVLSGGEKALTAISLIFSIFLVKPSPFCLLDEADAPLDDANIDRFNSLVREMSSRYQFLLITHNKRTMELADVLYGITMEKPGVSKVVSVKFQA
jgi:chromosome segregation protein